MTIVNSSPVLISGHDGSIIIGLTSNEKTETNDNNLFTISIKTRRLIGITNNRIVFDFDLKNDPHLEDIVEFAFSAREKPMVSVWEAVQDGMMPINNLIYHRE